MPSFDKLIEEKLKNLDKIPDDLITVVEKRQEAMLHEINEAMAELNTVDGKIVVSSKNIAKIEGIINKAKEVFFDKEYLNAVKAFVLGMDSQAKLTKEMIRAGIGPISNDDIYKLVLEQSQKDAIRLFSETVLDGEYFEPLREQLLLNITTGASLKEAIKSVRLITSSYGDGKAIIADYAKTWSRTSFAQADATYTTTISRQMNVQWYKYAGSAIETTRAFCETRHNKFYHVSEVEAWGDLDPWTGQIKGTNSRTIFANRGGWNCRHSIVPVSIFGVPKQDIQRNINKGTYKPTKSEQEWLDAA